MALGDHDEDILDDAVDEDIDQDDDLDTDDEVKASDGKDVDPILSRYQEAGIDLKDVDPVELAEGMAMSRRLKNNEVYTDKDVPNLVEKGVDNLLATPRGRQYLAQRGLFTRDDTQQAAAQSDTEQDPRDARLAALEQAVGGQNRVVRELMGEREAYALNQKADVLGGQLATLFRDAQQHVAGASKEDLMEDTFWLNVSAGKIGEAQADPHVIRAWVKSYVDTQNSSRAKRRRPKRRFVAERSAGLIRPHDKKESDVTVDDVLHEMESKLPD